jgi:hypothetical protein
MNIHVNYGKGIVMTKRTFGVSLAVLLAGSGAIGYAFAQAVNDDAGEDKSAIKLSDAPAPVRAAVAKITNEKNVTRVHAETNSDGSTTFDVAYQTDGKSSEAEISENGDVMEISTIINANALPTAAANALAKAFPNAPVKAAESKQVFFYEVVVSVNGQDKEVRVAASGQMGDDDDDDSEEGDDDDDDDSDEDGEDEDEEGDVDEGGDDESEEDEDD